MNYQGYAFSSVPQIVNIGNGGEPRDLDPQTVTGIPEFRILLNLFEGLVGKDPKTLDPLPGAAQSWNISEDGKVYTFKIRPNAKWSNGEPVTAQDFVYAFTRLLDPATVSEYAYQAHYIKNGRAFNTGTLKDASQLGVKALDKTTLEITLENPVPFFLSLLYHHSLLPVHRATVEKFGQRWTRPEHMVTNGPFLVDKWEINKVVKLKKNPHYWDIANVKLEEANFFPVEKHETEERMYRARELDIIDEVPHDKIPTWQGDKSGAYLQHPFLATYFYRCNITKPPLNNKEVRRALALAIDREKIVKLVTKAGQLPGTTFTPPGTGGGYKPIPRLPKDGSAVAEAKQLLAKAGFPEGKGFPPIELLYNTSDNHKRIAEAIQQMWKQNLGINIRLFNQEWKVYLDNERTMNYQISRAGWVGDYNDPNTFLDMFLTDGGNNKTGWSNKQYDALIAQAAAVTPEQFKGEKNLIRRMKMVEKRRFEIFQQAEDLLLEELPVIPIYIYTRVYLKNPKVQGWFPNIEDIHPLKYVSMSP